MNKVSISDEEKRQIMEELVRGNSELLNQEPSQLTPLDNQSFDPKDYKNFDDLAQRSRDEQRQLFSQSLHAEQSKTAMPYSIKERITTDINQAKELGQLRSERIREIVSSAVFQVASEVKSVSSDVNLIVKDAVSAVIENVQEKGGEIKEEVTASIEGAIEGVSSWRRQSLAKTQTEVKQLQARLDTEEDQLQQEIDSLLVDIEEAGKEHPPGIKASIESATEGLKNSEQVAVMQKSYAQLQAQAEILKANLAARYGGRYEEVKEHLDAANKWYDKTRPQAQIVVDQAEGKRVQLEEKMGDAGTALARKERRIRQVLSDLLQTASELLREKGTPSK